MPVFESDPGNSPGAASPASSRLNDPALVRAAAHWRRLIMPAMLLAVTVAALWYFNEVERGDRAADAVLADQRHLAQRVATAASELARGERSAFAALSATRADIAGTLRALEDLQRRAAQGRHAQPAGKDFAPLIDHWSRTRGDVARVLAYRVDMDELSAQVDAFQSIATGILVRSDELVDALVAAEAERGQIHVASRQLMLIQRVASSVRRVTQGGEGVLTAIDRLGRDAVLFGDVLVGMLNGNERLGVERLENQAALDIHESLSREFRHSMALIENIMDKAVAIAGLRDAAGALVDHARQNDAKTRTLASAYLEARRQRALTPELLYGLVVLSVISLLAAAGYLFRDGIEVRAVMRRRGEELRRRSLHHLRTEARLVEREREIETFVAEFSEQLAAFLEGHPGRRIEAPDALLEPLAEVLQRIIGHFSEDLHALDDDAKDLFLQARQLKSLSAGLDADVGEHRRQLEVTATATSKMATSVEPLSRELFDFQALARTSSGAVENASAQMDDAVSAVESVAGSGQETAGYVRRLNDAARQVQELRSLVDDLREQSKMLSLNIAIQSSMDTEGGRALSRFADEVQRLSERAGVAARRIESVNQGMRRDADAALDAIKRSVWSATSAGERIGAAGASLQELKTFQRRLAELNDTLSQVCQQHTVQITGVVKGLTAAHAGVRALSRGMREADELAGELVATTTSMQQRTEAVSRPASATVSELAAPAEPVAGAGCGDPEDGAGPDQEAEPEAGSAARTGVTTLRPVR